MADYYSILNKTISGLRENAPETREMVYNKARLAIEKQLRAMEPSPGDEAIASQMSLLEESITKVEAAYLSVVPASAVSEPPLEQAAPVADPVEEKAPEVEAEPEAAPAGSETPQAASPPDIVKAAGDVTPAAPGPATVTLEETIQQLEAAADKTETDAKAPEPVSPLAQDDIAVTLAGAGPEAEQAPEQVKEAETPPPVAELEQELRADDKQMQASQVPPPVATLEPGPELQADDRPDQMMPSGTPGPGGAMRSIGRLLPYVLALLILAGGAYALWLNKDALKQAYDDFGKQEETVVVAEPEPEPETAIKEPEVEEEAVRLGSNGEDIAVAPVENETGETETEIPLVLEPGSSAAVPSSEVQPVDEVSEAGENANTVQPAATPIVAETAYLYEEGGSGSGAARDNGSIVWSLIEESPGSGLAPEPVIKGEFNIPDKALTMVLKIRRNTDEALSASHIIELQFDTPEGFVGGEIDDVARFVMKTTEEARGEGLIAVPVRVKAGYFLVALNNLDQAVETNTRLLLESGWIDIPLGYTTGRRALVTFEKGEKGEKIFQEAFADWKNR